MRRILFGVVICASILLLMFTGHGGPAHDDSPTIPTTSKSFCGQPGVAFGSDYSARCIGR